MVRETRYLWVANLPEKITEDRISEHFKRYGKIQSVKFRKDNNINGALVAFTDIKSAEKAHNAENELENTLVQTEYSEPTATILTRGVTGITSDLTTPDNPVTPITTPNSSAPTQRNSTFLRTNFGRTLPSSGNSTPDAAETTKLVNSVVDKVKKLVANAENLVENDVTIAKTPLRGRPRDRFPANAALTHPAVPQPPANNIDSPKSRSGVVGVAGVGGGGGGGGYLRHTSETNNAAVDDDLLAGPARKTTAQQSQVYTKSLAAATSRRKMSNGPSQSRSPSSDSSSGSRSSSSSSDRSRSISTKSQSRSNSRTKHGSIRRDSPEPREEGHLGIFITGLPMRSTDSSLRDGLFHEYKKYGKVVAVSVQGQHSERFAIVTFKKHEDASKALEGSQGRRFFGAKIVVTEHEGIEPEDSEYRPPEAEMDEYHPKATRTLFVGNLEKDILAQDLKDIFIDYGEIIDVDIKKQPAGSSYAFVQFTDIQSVVKALHQMDGENIGANKIKLGFGKSMPTNCVWIDGVTDAVTEKSLCRQFSRHGPVQSCHIDRELLRALLYYDTVEIAQYTTSEVRGRLMGGRKLQVDFASRDCQLNFFEKMERTHQLRPGDYPDERLMMRPTRQGQNATFEEDRYDSRRGRFDGRASSTSSYPNATSAYTGERRPAAANSSGASFRGGGAEAASRQYRAQNSASGSAASSTRYQRELSEDYGGTERRRRHADEFSQASSGGGYANDDYEQELRDYSRAARRDYDSPSPYDSRESSPVGRRVSQWERFDDRAAERHPNERVRDLESGEVDPRYRSIPESKLRKGKKGDRNLSPTGSDYSQSLSSHGYRSRSESPGDRKKGRARTPIPTSPRPFDDFIQPVGSEDCVVKKKIKSSRSSVKSNSGSEFPKNQKYSDSSNSDSDSETKLFRGASEKGAVRRLREEAGFVSRTSDPEALKRKLHQFPSSRKNHKGMSSDSDQDLTEYDPTRPVGELSNLHKEKRELLQKLRQLDDSQEASDPDSAMNYDKTRSIGAIPGDRDPRLLRPDHTLDTTLSCRKQMEARRAEESRPVSLPLKPATLALTEPMDDTEPGPGSLRDVPPEFIGLKKRKKSADGPDRKRLARGKSDTLSDKTLFTKPDEDKWGVKRSPSLPLDSRLSKDERREREPMDLPLPKFAFEKHVQSPKVAASPRSHASPKGVMSPQISPSVKAHIGSPPFSPALVAPSPQLSPALPKDSKKELSISIGSPLSDDSMSPRSPLSPVHMSLEDRIRALDEKISKAESVRTVTPSTSSSLDISSVVQASVSAAANVSTPSTPLVDYHAKYRVKKRVGSLNKNALPGPSERTDRADLVTARILSRTSVFDQDSMRLEQKGLKFEPKDVYDPEDPLNLSLSPSKDIDVVNTYTNSLNNSDDIPARTMVESMDVTQGDNCSMESSATSVSSSGVPDALPSSTTFPSDGVPISLPNLMPPAVGVSDAVALAIGALSAPTTPDLISNTIKLDTLTRPGVVVSNEKIITPSAVTHLNVTIPKSNIVAAGITSPLLSPAVKVPNTPPTPPVGILKKPPTLSPPRPGILKKTSPVLDSGKVLKDWKEPIKIEPSFSLDEETPDLSPVVENSNTWRTPCKDVPSMPILKPELNLFPSKMEFKSEQELQVAVAISDPPLFINSMKRKSEQATESSNAKIPKLDPKITVKVESKEKSHDTWSKSLDIKAKSKDTKKGSNASSKKDDSKIVKEKDSKSSSNKPVSSTKSSDSKLAKSASKDSDKYKIVKSSDKTDKTNVSEKSNSDKKTSSDSQKVHKTGKPRTDSKSSDTSKDSKRSHSEATKTGSKKEDKSVERKKSESHKSDVKKEVKSDEHKKPDKVLLKKENKSECRKLETDKKAESKSDDKKSFDSNKDKNNVKKPFDPDKQKESKKDDDRGSSKEKDAKKEKDKKERSDKSVSKTKNHDKDPKDKDGKDGKGRGSESNARGNTDSNGGSSDKQEERHSEKKDGNSGSGSHGNSTNSNETKDEESRSRKKERQERKREEKEQKSSKQTHQKKERLPAAFRELKELGIDFGTMAGFSSMYDNIKRRSSKPKPDEEKSGTSGSKKRRPSYLDSEGSSDSSGNDSEPFSDSGKKTKKKSPSKPTKKNHVLADLTTSSDDDEEALLKLRQKKKGTKKSTAEVYTSSDSDAAKARKKISKPKVSSPRKTEVIKPKKPSLKKSKTRDIYTSSDSDEDEPKVKVNKPKKPLVNDKPKNKVATPSKGKLSELFNEISSSESSDDDLITEKKPVKPVNNFDDILKKTQKQPILTLKEEEDLKKNNIVFDKISSKIKALSDDHNKINEKKIHEIKSDLDYLKQKRKSNDFSVKEKNDKVFDKAKFEKNFDNCIKAVLDLEMHASLDISRSNSKYLDKSNMITKDSMYNRDLPLSLTENKLEPKMNSYDIHRTYSPDEERRAKKHKNKQRRHENALDVKDLNRIKPESIHDKKLDSKRNDVIKMNDVTIYTPIIFNHVDRHGEYPFDDVNIPIENEGVDNIVVEEQTIESTVVYDPTPISFTEAEIVTEPSGKHKKHRKRKHKEKDVEKTDIFNDVGSELKRSDSEHSLPELIIEEEGPKEFKVEDGPHDPHHEQQTELELKRSAEETDQAAKLLEEVVMKEDVGWAASADGLVMDEDAQTGEHEENLTGLDELQAAIASLAGETEVIADTTVYQNDVALPSEEEKEKCFADRSFSEVEEATKSLEDNSSNGDTGLLSPAPAASPMVHSPVVPQVPKTPEICPVPTVLPSPEHTTPIETKPESPPPVSPLPVVTEPEPVIQPITKAEPVAKPIAFPEPEAITAELEVIPSAKHKKKKHHKSHGKHQRRESRKSTEDPDDDFDDGQLVIAHDDKTEIEPPLAPLDHLQSMSAELFKPREEALSISTDERLDSHCDDLKPAVSSPSYFMPPTSTFEPLPLVPPLIINCDKTPKRRSRRSATKKPPKDPMSDISITIDGVLNDYDEGEKCDTPSTATESSMEVKLEDASRSESKLSESSNDSTYDTGTSPRRKSPGRYGSSPGNTVVSDIKTRLRPENKRRKPRRSLYMDENDNKDKLPVDKISAPPVLEPLTLSEKEREKKLSEYDFHDDDAFDNDQDLRFGRRRDDTSRPDEKTPEKEEGQLVIDESTPQTDEDDSRRSRSRRSKRRTTNVDTSMSPRGDKETLLPVSSTPAKEIASDSIKVEEDVKERPPLVTVLKCSDVTPYEGKKKRAKQKKELDVKPGDEESHDMYEFRDEESSDTSRLQDEVIAMAERAAAEAADLDLKHKDADVKTGGKEHKHKHKHHHRSKSTESVKDTSAIGMSDFLSNIDKIIAEVADGNFDINSIQDDPAAPPRRRGSRSNSKLHEDRPPSRDSVPPTSAPTPERQRKSSQSDSVGVPAMEASMPPPQFAPFHQERYQSYPNRTMTPPHEKNSPITPATPSSGGNSQFGNYQETKPTISSMKSPSDSAHHPPYRDDIKFESRSPPSSKQPSHYLYGQEGLVIVARHEQDRHDRYANERVFFPPERHLDRLTNGSKAPEHSKSPSGKLSPRSQNVHMGVVQAAPYSIVQRETLQSGQMIERVPNPNLGLMDGMLTEKLSPSEVAKLHSPKGMVPQGLASDLGWLFPDGHPGIKSNTPLASPNHQQMAALHGQQKGPGPSELRAMLSQPARIGQGQLRPGSKSGEMQLSPHGPSSAQLRLAHQDGRQVRSDPKHELPPHLADAKLTERFAFPPGDHRGAEQYYHPDFLPHTVLYHPGGIPVAHLDPRVMFQGQRPEFLAQHSPHVGLAMVAPHQGYPGHGRLTPDSRPPSRPLSAHGPQPGLAMRMPMPLFHVNAIPDAPTPTDLLLQRYPVMWQGSLALKNDSANVQMHFVSGGQQLVGLSLPNLPITDGTMNILRIAQRMRLETAQLDAVAKRMMNDEDFCMLLALPCGRDDGDLLVQTQALKTGFIHYLQQKQAAGIVNMPAPGSQQTAYVVHIFPPCEFSKETLARAAPDLYRSCLEIAHVLIVIATV